MTQYTDRGIGTLSIRVGKETDVDAFIEENPSFIPNPDLQENYLRKYGRGRYSKDLRLFDRDGERTQKEIQEARISHEYVLLALKSPITGITPDVVESISHNTGIDEKFVEAFLIRNYPHGNIDDFFLAYKEMASMGTEAARQFEEATCEMFRKIFRMKAVHVGPMGNTPDVFVQSDEYGFCGIIDNKAYKNGYSITGDHKRVMEDVYIPTYQDYGEATLPLAFFSYIAGSLKNTVNSALAEIKRDTGIDGSAMPVDLFINLAQDYAHGEYTHQALRAIFSVGREVSVSDIHA